MSFDKKVRAKILAQVLFWALENDIVVKLYQQHNYGGQSTPFLEFSRNGEYISISLWRLTDDSAVDFFKHELTRIGAKLCVAPFEAVKL